MLYILCHLIPTITLEDSHMPIFRMKKQALSNISKQVCRNRDLNPGLIWMKFWVFSVRLFSVFFGFFWLCLVALKILVPPVKDWTWARAMVSTKSQPLDHQGIPWVWGFFSSLFVRSVKDPTSALLANRKQVIIPKISYKDMLLNTGNIASIL